MKNFRFKTGDAGSIAFYGSQSAELFSREMEESIKGALENNLVAKDSAQFPRGFVKASIPGHPWDDTCWTRDCGAFLRELALWGHTEEACVVAEYLTMYVSRNPEGFYTYPEKFQGWEKAWGYEMDGTANIVVGMVRLWQRLPQEYPLKGKIYGLLSGGDSPIAYIAKKLEEEHLISGTGEFGGGWGVEGSWYNIVQNNLVRQALLAFAEVEEERGKSAEAGVWRRKAADLLEHMLELLVNPEDGSWYWSIDPQTLKPDNAALNFPLTRATASINGVGSSYADAEGLEPVADMWPGASQMSATLDKIYKKYPLRKEQFEKYGMCTFVDYDETHPLPGYASWLSYCDCYAAQTMILLGKTQLLDRVLNWITASTYMGGSPSVEFIKALSADSAEIDFDNPASAFWFTERNFSPDYSGGRDIGCGKLNLVNVAEPMKLARMMLGVDDRFSEEVSIVPRLPENWKGVEARNWPVKTSEGTVLADILFDKSLGASYSLRLNIEAGKRIPCLSIRFPNGERKKYGPVSGTFECKVPR